jgi:hypothetical protein
LCITTESIIEWQLRVSGVELGPTATFPLHPCERRGGHPHRRAVPQLGCERPQQSGVLFDHLVGPSVQVRCDVNAERLRCLQIDHELENSRLHRRSRPRCGPSPTSMAGLFGAPTQVSLAEVIWSSLRVYPNWGSPTNLGRSCTRLNNDPGLCDRRDGAKRRRSRCGAAPGQKGPCEGHD